MPFAALLAHLVDASRRHAVRVVLGALLLAVLAGLLAATRLGVSTDTDQLFAASLPWRRSAIAFDKAFPQFRDLIVAVVDGATPEEADATAAALEAALEAARTAPQPAPFLSVRRPDSSPYLRQNGLLLLGRKDLQEVLNRTIDAQPFLGQLVADPSARGLFAALTLLGIGVEQGQADLAPYAPALSAFHQALAAAAAGRPKPLSWQRLLGGKLADQAGPYRFVLVQPKLDFGALQPGAKATAVIRAVAARLPMVRAGLAHVRLTGQVVLADEEFATVAQGALAATLISAALVLLWLVLAVRSWRLIVPMALTLALGLLLTTGFAALAVGTLNLVSVAFAVLFVGIAVDFAIQYAARLREHLARHEQVGGALVATAHEVGPQILVAAAATAAGFYAFVPTSFSGVAELGLIAGTGMVIAFLCTMVFLPALLVLMRPGGTADAGIAIGDVAERGLDRWRGVVFLAFAALSLLGLLLLGHLRFDSDPLHTKDPNTEAMRTLHDLMGSPLTNPYSVDILAPSQAAADALAAKLAALPQIGDVITLSSFIPQHETEKLALLGDAANLLAATLAPRSGDAPVTPADLRLAAGTAQKELAGAVAKATAAGTAAGRANAALLAPLAADLANLHAAPDATLMAANAALTEFLPQQLDTLRAALAAKPVTAADLPPEIARDWRLPDGRVRVQALGRPGADNAEGLSALVAAVRKVAPDAGGSAVTIVATAATITEAFRTAAIGAVLAIMVILALVLRRWLDVVLVIVPLLVSGLLTVVAMALLHLTLNFANIIALPLLLGVGVSFNIYFVMNWRAGRHRFLGSATARAILFSALTTGTAFSSLAMRAHPGTASLGVLLLVSLACTLLTTLVLMPPLLRLLRR
ncbi:MAG: MMPL family transporter [Rhodospirillales bacterium]|nr:MMPL family transporter [Rhodospirillales bacterium]